MYNVKALSRDETRAARNLAKILDVDYAVAIKLIRNYTYCYEVVYHVRPLPRDVVESILEMAKHA